jgi:FMN phosphatase YigB (HAD superfamily)
MSEEELTIFLDAEGTLYVPKNKGSYKEFWKAPSLKRALEMFRLDDDVLTLLKKLRKKKVPVYVCSMHKEAILLGMLEEFGIKHFFKEILINGDKGRRIKEVARRARIPLGSCIMVGDRYDLDIEPTMREGIRSYLIDRWYNRDFKVPRIGSLLDILEIIERYEQ